MRFLPLLTLAFLPAVAVVSALPVERDAQKDELVTRCIIETLSNALSEQDSSPVTSECREILKSEKHEVAEKKYEGGNNYYEEDKHLEDSENPPYEDKGSQRAVEEYQRRHYEEDKQSDDESEERQHYKQDHEEEKTEVNNSEEESRSIEDFYPVRNTYHVRDHGDRHSNQQHEERRYADKRIEQDNERTYRKHSEEDTTHEQEGSQKADSTESTINVSHHKRQDIRSEEPSEEDEQFGIHGHSNERRLGRIDTGAEGSNEDLNNQDNRNGQYDHKKPDSEDLEEQDSEEGEKLHNGPIHYQKRNNYVHSDEDRSVHRNKKDSDISDESSEDLESIKNIHNYLKRYKNQVEYEDKTNRHSMSSSEESKEEKHLDKRTNSEEKKYNEEEEKRHHTDYKRHHSEEEEEEDEKRYYSKEKQHNSEEKTNNPNEKKHQREESTEERYTSNGKDEEEERNTVQQFWSKKRHSLEDRYPGSEEEIKRSEHGHFYPEYEERDDKRQRTEYEKRREEQDQGQNEERNEEHPIRQNLDHDFQEERMYDRMDKLAHYLKSRKPSMEIPKLYDSEDEKGKQNHNEGKKKMNHRVLTEEEAFVAGKELENLAAMDLELEKMAEKLHDHHRD